MDLHKHTCLGFYIASASMEMMETVEVYEESDVRIGEEVESCYTLMEVTSPKRKKRNKTQEDSTEKQKKPR